MLLRQLAEANARELELRGDEIHSTIYWVVVLCVALGVVVLGGGLLLFRWARRAVQEYERSTAERIRELDEFAGRVAHDLRNPLQTIIMALAVAESRAPDDRTRATCGKARDSARRMAAFIQELLTFARSGATPSPGASAVVDQALRDVQQDLAHSAEEKGVALRVHAASPGIRAAIAPEALRAIVANLADNAVKHMPPDRPVREVELSTRAAAGAVEVVVRDTGVGIPADVLPRLFEQFFRATDRPGGFGIGLRTVKRLVDAHAGRIAVESEEGAAACSR